MLRYFWSDNAAIPPGLYTANFSPGHIAWVLAVLCLMPVAVLLYRRLPERIKNRIIKSLALVMVLCETSSWLWQAAAGSFDVRYSLPLQLCDISVFIELAAVYKKPFPPKLSALSSEFSYALSMPAALAAVITPGWYYPFFTYGYLKMAVMHTLLILIPVLLVWGGGFRPDVRRLPKVALLFVLFIGLAVTANVFLGSNYMFLAYVPPDTTLVVFQTWFGNPGYEIPEFILLLLIWTALYVPWIVSNKRRK